MGPALACLIVVVAVGGYFGGRYVWGAYHAAAARTSLASRDFPTAERHLLQAITIWPEDAELRFLAGQTARRKGDWAGAARHLEFCNGQPGLAEAVALELQLQALQKGDFSQAGPLLASCKDSSAAPRTPLILEAWIDGNLTALMPLHLQGKIVPGRRYGKQVEELHEWISFWLQLLPAVPDQVQGLIWRGQAHVFGLNPAQAKADFGRALELDPKHLEARLHLGLLLTEEDLPAAAEQLQLVWDQQPNNIRAGGSLAVVRHLLGELTQAREILDSILARDPDSIDALLERGRVALDMDDPDAGEAYLRRALDVAPNHAKAHMALSICLNRVGKLEEAQFHRDRYRQLQLEFEKTENQKLKKETGQAG
jgi:tetratricopeptide (TPR) repeat protein